MRAMTRGEDLSDGSRVYRVVVTDDNGNTVTFHMDTERSAQRFAHEFYIMQNHVVEMEVDK